MIRSQTGTVGRTPRAANSATTDTRLPRSSPFRPIIRELDREAGMGVLVATTAVVGLGLLAQEERWRSTSFCVSVT